MINIIIILVGPAVVQQGLLHDRFVDVTGIYIKMNV